MSTYVYPTGRPNARTIFGHRQADGYFLATEITEYTEWIGERSVDGANWGTYGAGWRCRGRELAVEKAEAVGRG